MDRRVITIGNFDGVHRGHQAILAQARRLADEHGVPLRVLTFDPHPVAVLRPQEHIRRLMSATEKREALQARGADEVVVLQPVESLLKMGAEQFVDWLVEHHRPVAVVEGQDFHFGADRSGDTALLEHLGRQHGFATRTVAPVVVGLDCQLTVRVSSSLTRWFLERGRVTDAAVALGYPFGLSGRVEEGERRGRTIGFPTANLAPVDVADRLVPGDGVYAGLAELEDGSAWPAAISIGRKPTFSGISRTIEAHLLDATRELYGQSMRLRFCRWLREQRSFPAVPALQQQLVRDVQQTREWHRAGRLASVVAPAFRA